MILAVPVALWLAGLLRAHVRRLAANRRLAERLRQPLPDAGRSTVSLIVPVKGDVPAAHLEAGDAAMRDLAGALLLVMESAAEPAGATAKSYLSTHPESRWRIVLSGPCPPEDNGKIHNLAAGIDASNAEVLLFADADVVLSDAMIRNAVALLRDPQIGGVFCPPYYEPSAHPGAGLLAAFTNYWFMPAMARSDERGQLAYMAGACYGLTRATYERFRLFHTRRDLISEDAALGQLLAGAGLTIRLVPAIARMPADRVSIGVALDHLRRWMLLGRVIAPSSFRQIPLSFEIPWGLALMALLQLPLSGTCIGLLVLLAIWPIWYTRTLNRMFWGSPGPPVQALWWVVFQSLVPWLWLDAALTRRMVWRGRTYRLDRAGKIVGSG